jgi:hypothetical protein
MTKTTTGALAVALALAACGCGGGTGTVSGKVSYLGKSLTGGTVTCMAKGSRPFYGMIGADGTYTVTGVPAGPVTLAVQSGSDAGEPPVPLPEKDQAPAPARPPASKAKPPVQIPKQYTSPDSSGLALNVVTGVNPFDIELK